MNEELLKEKRRAYERAYRTKHKEEYREKKRRWDIAYREKHKDELKLKSKEYYQKNRQAIIQRTTRYHFENKEWVKKYYQKYYEEIRLESLTKVDPSLKCAMCGCDDARFLEINHINGGGSKEAKTHTNGTHNLILLIHHGKRGVENLNLLCRACNSIDHLERVYGHTGLKAVWEKSVTNTPDPSLNQILCNLVKEKWHTKV